MLPQFTEHHLYKNSAMNVYRPPNPYTQEDITLLVNHINSTKRPGLNNLSPYEMISEDDEDMHRLMKLLDLKPIPADEVNLTKQLLSK